MSCNSSKTAANLARKSGAPGALTGSAGATYGAATGAGAAGGASSVTRRHRLDIPAFLVVFVAMFFGCVLWGFLLHVCCCHLSIVNITLTHVDPHGLAEPLGIKSGLLRTKTKFFWILHADLDNSYWHHKHRDTVCSGILGLPDFPISWLKALEAKTSNIQNCRFSVLLKPMDPEIIHSPDTSGARSQWLMRALPDKPGPSCLKSNHLLTSKMNTFVVTC